MGYPGQDAHSRLEDLPRLFLGKLRNCAVEYESTPSGLGVCPFVGHKRLLTLILGQTLLRDPWHLRTLTLHLALDTYLTVQRTPDAGMWARISGNDPGGDRPTILGVWITEPKLLVGPEFTYEITKSLPQASMLGVDAAYEDELAWRANDAPIISGNESRTDMPAGGICFTSSLKVASVGNGDNVTGSVIT